MVYGCLPSLNDLPLLPEFTLEQPVDSVYAIELVLDIAHSVSPLPDWWRMDPGQCRQGQLVADVNFGSVGCVDPWSGNGVAAVQGFFPGQPGNASNHARVLVAVAVPSHQAVTLAAGVNYVACRVALHTANSTICSGCSSPACLVLNSIQIHRLPGSSYESVLISAAVSPQANWVSWQGGTGANCAAVPVRRHTWGALKSLYR